MLDSAVATSTVTITPLDDAPVAQPDAFTTDENAVLSGSVFPDNGSGADSDVDGPALQVGAVNGSAADVGMQITLASGALLTVNADGTFNYDPNGAFDDLPDRGLGRVQHHRHRQLHLHAGGRQHGDGHASPSPASIRTATSCSARRASTRSTAASAPTR